MAAQEPDGKNSLVGEFLLALARAPENVQEDIVLYGLKRFSLYTKTLIEPYPMLSHLQSLVGKKDSEGK
jgi:hypothetical protein